MSGTNGANDLVDLFSRVTALEQSDVNTDQTLAAIVKNYSYLGLEITISVNVHDYRLCQDPDTYTGTVPGLSPSTTLYPSATLTPTLNSNYLVDGVICAADCYI
jgi:hypothetical protein